MDSLIAKKRLIEIKRAQVSVFIVLGLIVLFAVVLFIYFKMTFVKRADRRVGESMHPVESYVTDCLRESGMEAARIIARQGGFIDIPTNLEQNPSMHVSPDGMGIVKIPYWFYKGSRYNPSLEMVENDIAEFVKRDVKECINEFEAFEQYEVRARGDMKVRVSLNRNDFSIEADYPLRIFYKANNSHTDIDSFRAEVPVRLRKILEIATQMLESELRGVFLENFTLDLVAAHPNIPFSGMEFECRRMEWNIKDIEEKVREMLFYNLPRIRIRNTDYRPFAEPEPRYKRLLGYDSLDILNGNYPEHMPSDSYEYLHMFWDIGIEEDKNIDIALSMYPALGIDLDAKPNDNGVLRSKFLEGNREFMRFLCINIYHFVYDINYPVIITIRDDLSLNGNGYVFRFAMPVTIHNNEPYKQNYGYDLFTSTYYDRGFCEERGDEVFDIRAAGREDGYSGMDLEGVNISMQCIKYYCGLGKTRADGGYYRLRTTLPATCSNPFIIAEKEGYLKARKQITGEMLEIEMKKLKELDYEIVYHTYNSISGEIGEAQELEDDMEISIQMITDDLAQYKACPYEGESRIELIEGDAEYDLNIALTQDGDYFGGYNAKWEAEGMDVAEADKVVFHVIKYVPMAYTKEDKMNMMMYILEGNYKEVIKPELAG